MGILCGDSSTTCGPDTPMLRGNKNSMLDSGENPATGYSKWKASTEQIHVQLSDTDKTSCLRSLSWKRWLIIVVGCVIIALIMGFIAGYLTRRASYLQDTQAKSSSSTGGNSKQKPDDSTTTSPTYQKYSTELFERLASNISVDNILTYIGSTVQMAEEFPPGSVNAHGVPKELVSGHCTDLGLMLKSVNSFKVLLSLSSNSDSYQLEVGEGSNVESPSNAEPRSSLIPHVAYTVPGTATGPVAYCGFGRRSDFLTVNNYTGAVCHIRYGKISPFFKIFNAHNEGCVGVVLFPDIKDYPNLGANEALSSNAKLIDGDPLTPGIASIDSGFKLKQDAVTGQYLPPPIPTVSVSRNKVSTALKQLTTNTGVGTPEDWVGSIPDVVYGNDISTDANVSISSSNRLMEKDISTGICALRGSIDTDKFLIVGTHHDAVGHSLVDPITGQSVLREMLRILSTSDEYKPRRSVIFITGDATTLKVSTKEWIEANAKEFNDRVTGFLAINGPLGQGNRLVVKSTPPLNNFITETIGQYQSQISDVKYSSVDGDSYYLPYMSDIAVPVMELSFTDDKQAGSTPESLPDLNTNPLNRTKVELAARMHLDIIMRLLGEPILPYSVLEISDLVQGGLDLVKTKVNVDPELVQDFVTEAGIMRKMLTTLDGKLKSIKGQDIGDVNLRRVNDALTGITRSFVLEEGVPMLNINDPTKVVRNLNNKNMLIGCTSMNPYEVVTFPGLIELTSAPLRSEEIDSAITKHVTQIYLAIDLAIDYSMRAIMDSDVFDTKSTG